MQQLIVSLLPFAETPETLDALPSRRACAPTMTSVANPEPVDASFGFTRRSIASLKLSAVTASPFENLKPG